MSRFQIAMLAYAAIAVLAWQTLSDQKLRLLTFALLGLFAVKTLLQHLRSQAESKEHRE